MSLKQNDIVEEMVKEIMQDGFECAMAGDMFKDGKENLEMQEKLYQVTLEKHVQAINSTIFHHSSGFNYCEQCMQLKNQQFIESSQLLNK